MVQFSTLQGNTSMQTTLSSLRSTQNFTQAAAMLGKQVTLQVDANTATQGVVTGIDVTTGTPKIVVNNQAYDLGQVLSVTNPSAAGTGTSSTPVLTPTTTTASGLVPTLGTAPAAPAQSNH
jgi:flagellar hook assembly protein FlgD